MAERLRIGCESPSAPTANPAPSERNGIRPRRPCELCWSGFSGSLEAAAGDQVIAVVNGLGRTHALELNLDDEITGLWDEAAEDA